MEVFQEISSRTITDILLPNSVPNVDETEPSKLPSYMFSTIPSIPSSQQLTLSLSGSPTTITVYTFLVFKFSPKNTPATILLGQQSGFIISIPYFGPSDSPTLIPTCTYT